MVDKKSFLKDNLIYISMIFWIVNEIMSGSNLTYVLFWKKEVVNDAVSAIVFVLLMIQLLFYQIYTKRELQIIILLAIPILISAIVSGHYIMASTWLFIFAFKNADFQSFLKYIYYALVFAVALVILLYIFGIINESILYREGEIRHSLGFMHPNYFGIQLFHIVMCNYCLQKDNKSILKHVYALAVLIIVIMYPNTQTAIVTIVYTMLMTLFYDLIRNNERAAYIYSNVLIFMSFAVNVVSIILSFIDFNSNTVLKTIDKIMAERFSQCHKTMNYYHVSLFGNKIINHVFRGRLLHGSRFYLDNGYMAILLRYGVAVYVLFSLFFLLTMIYLKKRKMYYYVLVFSCFSIYGMMENNYFSLSQNVFLLLVSYYLFQKDFKVNEELKKKIKIHITFNR